MAVNRDETTRNNERGRQLAYAIAAMVGASALIAITSLIAKALGNGVGGEALHPLQVSFGRFVFALCVIGPFGLWLRPSLAGAAWHLHIGRATLGWLTVTCFFAAAARMALSDATAISFLSPLVTMALAIVVLRERVEARRWYAAALALVGVFVLIRPGTDAFQPAAIIALAAAGFMGFEIILIKRLSDREAPIRILLINNVIGTAISAIAASFVWQWPTQTQWALLFLLGATMACAQVLFLQALKRADASYITPFFYTTLIFATAYDFAVFGIFPGAFGIAGALLIVAGVLLLTLPRSGK